MFWEWLTTFPRPRVNRNFRGKVLGQLVAKTELICSWVKGHSYSESCHLPNASYESGKLIIFFLTLTIALWNSFIPILQREKLRFWKNWPRPQASKFHSGLPAMSSVPCHQTARQSQRAIAPESGDNRQAGRNLAVLKLTSTLWVGSGLGLTITPTLLLFDNLLKPFFLFYSFSPGFLSSHDDRSNIFWKFWSLGVQNWNSWRVRKLQNETENDIFRLNYRFSVTSFWNIKIGHVVTHWCAHVTPAFTWRTTKGKM